MSFEIFYSVSLPNTGVDELCLSPASANSLLIVSDDDDVESSGK